MESVWRFQARRRSLVQLHQSRLRFVFGYARLEGTRGQKEEAPGENDKRESLRMFVVVCRWSSTGESLVSHIRNGDSCLPWSQRTYEVDELAILRPRIIPEVNISAISWIDQGPLDRYLSDSKDLPWTTRYEFVSVSSAKSSHLLWHFDESKQPILTQF